MTQLLSQPDQTNASRQAERVFDTNLKAISARQPLVATAIDEADSLPEGLVWLFGRDGSLTARQADGRWWGGSSLPLQVGRALMTTLDLAGSVGCFLSPATAGQIRAVLDKIEENQAIIVVMPDEAAALVALHCDDFSAETRNGRMSFALGADWAEQLTDLLESTPGLCVPHQYIRTGLLADAELSAMTAVANPILSGEIARRSKWAGEFRARWPNQKRNGKICVAGGSRFALWELGRLALGGVTESCADEFRFVDEDQPTNSSPIALAMAAEECEGIVSADLFRADLPGVMPDEMPWVTWATKPRFPAPGAADSLLLAEESWKAAAIAAGWSPNRMAVAGWPNLVKPTPIQTNGPIALIANAVVAAMPKKLSDFSSQQVLWDSIAAELSENPLALGSDVEAYLSSRTKQLSIAIEAVDRNLFSRSLILPTWIRGVARLLIKQGRQIAVFGKGWDNGGDEFANCWRGPIGSIDDLQRAVDLAAAIVHPSPDGKAHAVFAMGRPILIPGGKFRQAGSPATKFGVLSGELIRSVGWQYE